MTTDLPPELRCPRHPSEVLRVGPRPAAEEVEHLECARACSFPVIDEIPRFVDSEAYAASFGRQWKMFAKTQLDSYTNTSISRDRLARCLGGSLDVVTAPSVLEAGCGGGWSSEILPAGG